jgi:hypothetical protein
VFDKLDYFAIPIPAFTLEGSTKVGSPFGTFLSLFMYVLILITAIPKGISCAKRSRPNIIESIDPQGTDLTEDIHLPDKNFHIAFGTHSTSFDNYVNPVVDSEFVEWVVYADVIDENLETVYVPFTTHKCTQTDFEKFYDPLDFQAPSIQKMKDDEIFYCLDETDIYGEPIDYRVKGNGESLISGDTALNWMLRPKMPPLDADEETSARYLKQAQDFLGESALVTILYNSE